MKYLTAGDWTIRIVAPATIVSARPGVTVRARPVGVEAWLEGRGKLVLLAAGEYDVELETPAYVREGLH